MSTRVVITVSDEDNQFSVYRHCDGYPQGEHGVINTLKKALPFAWELPRFEADDFAAAIIRAWKNRPGDIRFTTGPDAHGDLSYTYALTFKDGELFVTIAKEAIVYDGPLSAYNDEQ